MRQKKKQTGQLPNYVNVAQAAEMLGCTKRTIARMCLFGIFPGAVKVSPHRNSALLIPEQEVLKYLQKKSAPASGEADAE